MITCDCSRVVPQCCLVVPSHREKGVELSSVGPAGWSRQRTEDAEEFICPNKSGLPKSWNCAFGSHRESLGRWYDHRIGWRHVEVKLVYDATRKRFSWPPWTWIDRLRGICCVPAEEIGSFLQLVPNIKSSRPPNINTDVHILTLLDWQPREVEEKMLALGQRSSTLQPNHFPLHLCVNSRSQRKSTTSTHRVIGTAVIWLCVTVLRAKPFRVWQTHFLPFRSEVSAVWASWVFLWRLDFNVRSVFHKHLQVSLQDNRLKALWSSRIWQDKRRLEGIYF